MHTVSDSTSVVNPFDRDKMVAALLEDAADLDGQQLAQLVGRAEELLQAADPTAPVMSGQTLADIESLASPVMLGGVLATVADGGEEMPHDVAERACTVLTSREATPAERRLAWRALELVEPAMRPGADDEPDDPPADAA